jgi:hypothetical protein
MKNLKTFGILAVSALALSSCSKDDNNQTPTQPEFRPTEAKWDLRHNTIIEEITQNFTMNADAGLVTLTSAKGVQIKINGNCLTKNGNPVTGQVAIEYIEVFDGGTMLLTDKTTMGQLPDGNMGLIISGGEFFIKATQNGVALATTCNLNLVIPANLSGGLETGMLLWNGAIDAAGNLDWKRQADAAGQGGVFGEGQGVNGAYYAALSDFGWTNVDKFYSDPRPKTTILASAPTGYNYQNCAIYLHYDGEGNALAKLDTFDSVTNLFSEHYGQIPIGLACHIIFVSLDANDNYVYAIKSATISANATYNFTLPETTVGTATQLKAAINALP